MRSSLFQPVLLSSLLILTLLLGCGTENEPTFKLTTTVSPVGSGTILPSQTTFDKGEIAILEAVPTNGWKFIRWEGDLTSSVNPVNLGMTRDYNIIGIFERRDYPLTVTVEGQGSVTERVVTAKTTDYSFETIVELTPTPASGWVFKEWSGDLTGSQNPARITVTGPKTVVAKFERKNYALTVTVEGQGTVTERVVMAKSTDYPFETIVELTPVPAVGWAFKEWSGDLTGSQSPARITLTGPKTVVARFMTSPAVSTGSVSNLSATGASVAGSVTSDGGNPVTARGICYATTQNPTTSGTCVASGSGTGTFSADLTGLSSATIYYARVYATNSIGTSYGDQLSFTTLDSFIPAGIVAHWTFEGNANDVAGSYSPNANGVVAITYNPSKNAKLGTAATFNGTTSIIEIPNGDALMNTQNFTISFWVKANSAGQVDGAGNPKGHFVMGLGAFLGLHYEIFGGYDGAKFAIRYDLGNGTTDTEDMWFPSLATDATNGGWQGWDFARSLTVAQMQAKLKDNWYHVTFTFNGASKVGTLYYDGEKMKSQNFNLWPADAPKRGVRGLKYGGAPPEVVNELAFGFIKSRAGTLWANEPLGGYNQVTANHFRGQLDDIKIYHRVLTPEEILQMYNSEK